MRSTKTKKSSFKAGMYLLETLTSGMYNQPLTIFREYIQNSVDSIDAVKTKKTMMTVSIDLDPFSKKIMITDNGDGLSAKIAEQVLSNIGISNKIEKNLRGFRGIGRLGGIAFSEKVTFITKSKNENIESIQEWDCIKLNELINNKQNNSMSLRKLFNKTTTFSQHKVNKNLDSYFKVILGGVSSFKNYLFDIKRIKNYLCEVSPLSFNYDEFSFGKDIDNFLTRKLSLYGKYKILINGESLYKPYKDIIKVTKKGIDIIEDIDFFEVKIKDKPVAYGWYGKRKDLLGSISKCETSAGIKIRKGNILIGDSHLFDSCFRENRFNSYSIGEVHIDSNKLVPNSRRDDFVDNKYKSLFYNEIERVIGLPLSKEIRRKSKDASSQSNKKSVTTCSKLKPVIESRSFINNSGLKITGHQHRCQHVLIQLDKCLACKNINSCDVGASLYRLTKKN